MEGTRPEYGILYWAGGHGTSRDIQWDKAPTFLIPKEYVLSPMPEVEKEFALNDMKQWCCCILQLCDCTGDPFKGALFYSMFLNELPGVNHWVCTGEDNKDGIFHVHAMLKTNQRSDSCARSMRTCWDHFQHSENITRRFGKEPQMELIKIQKCHRPSSMLKYIMKQPHWVASNHEKLLQLCYDLDCWNLNEKYKQSKEPPTETSAMNPMVQDLISVIVSHSCKTFQDCLRADPNTMAKYLHRPGLPQILQNCFDYCKATGGGWHISLFNKYTPDPAPIHAVLLHQGLVPSAVDLILWQWINKLDPKRNCICLQGPSNTGKSAFIRGFKETVPWGEIVNSSSPFAFEALIDQQFGVWEEPLISPEQAEKTKQILEGMPCSIPIKYKAPKILPRIPIIITTNHDLWRFCQPEEDAFRNRVFFFPFLYPCQNEPLSYRACEYSCKCYYCCTSRGSPSTHGGASPGRVQRTNQPLSTGEHGSLRTTTERDVGTGSVPSPGEGTSRRYSSQSGSAIGCSDSECTDTAEPTRSSSTTIGGIHGRDDDTGPGNTGDRIYRALTTINQQLVSDIDIGNTGHDSGPNGSGSTGKHKHKRKRGGTPEDLRQPHSPGSLGRVLSNVQEKTLPVPPKKRVLDRQLGTLTIPTQADWRNYFCFLLSRYG
nr:NS1 [Mute swan feces associated chapparvovirus 5]